MARYDVFARADSGPGYLLDCQANVLRHLNTRFVVPLLPADQAPLPVRRLNPIFEIDGAPHVMMTQFASAVLARELGRRVTSLTDQDTTVDAALDLLLTGT